MSDQNNKSQIFPDKINPMNSLLPRNLRRSVEDLPINPIAPPASTLTHPPPSFSHLTGFLPPDIHSHYLNLLAMNSPLLSPFLRQLLNTFNKNAFREQANHPPLPTPHKQQRRRDPTPSASISSEPASPHSLPRQHEVEEAGEIVYSIVEGEKVMGFNVWGEVRLCLPHLLRFVLHDIDIEEIGQAITRLRISCTKCSSLQLATLHGCSALPSEVTSCGLIRKSDGERMLKYLRGNRTRPSLKDALKGLGVTDEKTESDCLETFIEVTHDCFGSQKGRVYTFLYKTATSECILCHGCGKMFSPTSFVGHHHSQSDCENCIHWGFNSTNWRSYLHLDTDSLNSRTTAGVDGGATESSKVAVYKRFEDFKLKFLKPLRLPKEILKMVERLEKRKTTERRGLSPKEGQPLDCSTSKQKMENKVSPPRSNQEVQFGPNHKIRRLWAPHKGHFNFPEPPKLMANCSTDQLPNHLNSGTPNILDPSCIITKDSAHLYSRDFIPNVCLQQTNNPDDLESQLSGLSKSLPCVPSNDDVSSCSASASDLYSRVKSLTRTSRSVIRRSTPQLHHEFGPSRRPSQDLTSIDSSPARARHSSCIHDSIFPMNLYKCCSGTLDTVRCPSVDSVTLEFKLRQQRVARTVSNPELNTSPSADAAVPAPLIRPGVKRDRPGSRSLTPKISPIRRKRFSGASISEGFLAGTVENVSAIGTPEAKFQPSVSNLAPSSPFVSAEPSTSTGMSQLTPEMLLNLATQAPPRVPDLVVHWISTLERVNRFCNTVAPDDEESKQRFEAEKQKMFADLTVIREKTFDQTPAVLDQNRGIWKMAMDALIASSTPPSLTPNTQAPPFGIIPGVNPGLDPLGRMIQLFHGVNLPSEAGPSTNNTFRQSSAALDVPLVNTPNFNLQRLNLWPPPTGSQYFPNFVADLAGQSSRLLSNGFQTPRGNSNNPNIEFIPPQKRQRLLRHSTLATHTTSGSGYHHHQQQCMKASCSSSSLRTDDRNLNYPGPSS